MTDSDSEQKTARLEPELRDMKIEEGVQADVEDEGAVRVKVEDYDEPERTLTPLPTALKVKSRSATQSPTKLSRSTSSTPVDGESEEVVGGDITLKMEPGKAPKLARTASKKVISRAAPLYLDLPDASEESKTTFGVLPECTYGNKYLGTTEHAFECDCSEEWDSIARVNNACGEDSDCINRATKMECVGDCACGTACQNQRFQRKQYADVAVIKTEKKGYGLRANSDLKPGDFIFEYIGEVIDERTFRRRMIQYDEDGIKHFYFMSLTKGEFVDATKKGNLGRFCNHSCNPNCFVDKWVVGDKLRMGIFAERKIKAGEELVFNYNVDRYGAEPQPCYCGEPNCSGFIGGKTQTDDATKLSHATIEALGIDNGDGWSAAAGTKKPRKRKTSEDDEEYINDLQPKGLDEGGVNKVMAALRQCTEKWVAVKLLSRIQCSEDEKVGHRVIRVHGYEILKSTITAWMDDANVVLQILDILHKLPRITRNKIQDSKIEETIEKLKAFDDERVQDQAAMLLKAWSKLEVAYRIPRHKRDPNVGTPAKVDHHFDRRERGRERSRSRSKSPSITAPKGPSNVPSGPRAFSAPRVPAFFNNPRPPHRPRAQFNELPQGWFKATSPENGQVYYYNSSGATQWTKPTLAAQAPPPPPKAKSNEQKLQDIISSITSNTTPTNLASASATPQRVDEQYKNEKSSKSEKWRKLPQDKQEKLYEVTLQPHVMAVVAHYRKKLEKDDLKRLAKEVAKKLVRGDYKHGKVKDPTAKLDSRHEKTVKKFVKDFMDKAVQKKEARDKGKAARAEQKATDKAEGKISVEISTPDTTKVSVENDELDYEMLVASEREEDDSQHTSPTDLKRKRYEDGGPLSPKRSRSELASAPPPPPPPPPPAEGMPSDAETSFTPIDEDSQSSLLDSAEQLDITLAHNQDMVTNRLKQNDEALKTEGLGSPMQLATPPTTTSGSCEDDSAAKDGVHNLGKEPINGGS